MWQHIVFQQQGLLQNVSQHTANISPFKDSQCLQSVMSAVLVMELTISTIVTATTIISTHCNYLWMDGQAELAWVAG